ncbi:hypothetical protein L9F63_021040, partial [Diploptera punctata]
FTVEKEEKTPPYNEMIITHKKAYQMYINLLNAMPGMHRFYFNKLKLFFVLCLLVVNAFSKGGFEKIPDQGVGRAVKHSDSCLKVDENTIREFIVSVLSEDESDSNSSSNGYSFDE